MWRMWGDACRRMISTVGILRCVRGETGRTCGQSVMMASSVLCSVRCVLREWPPALLARGTTLAARIRLMRSCGLILCAWVTIGWDGTAPVYRRGRSGDGVAGDNGWRSLVCGACLLGLLLTCVRRRSTASIGRCACIWTAPLGTGSLRGTGTVVMVLWGLCSSLRGRGIGSRGRRTTCILLRLRRG